MTSLARRENPSSAFHAGVLHDGYLEQVSACNAESLRSAITSVSAEFGFRRARLVPSHLRLGRASRQQDKQISVFHGSSLSGVNSLPVFRSTHVRTQYRQILLPSSAGAFVVRGRYLCPAAPSYFKARVHNAGPSIQQPDADHGN
jgi:hypothetical protein